MTIDPTTCSNLEWFRYCGERLYYWERVLEDDPQHTTAGYMRNAMVRQRMITWGRMTADERDAIAT